MSAVVSKLGWCTYSREKKRESGASGGRGRRKVQGLGALEGAYSD